MCVMDGVVADSEATTPIVHQYFNILFFTVTNIVKY